MTPQTNFKVKDKQFMIQHWTVTQTYKNLPIVGNYFATPFSMMMAAANDEDDAAVNIAGAVNMLFTSLEGDNIIDLINLALSDVYYQGNRVVDNIDEIFAENPAGVMTLMTKVLEVHYGPFIREGLKDLQEVLVKTMGVHLNLNSAQS